MAKLIHTLPSVNTKLFRSGAINRRGISVLHPRMMWLFFAVGLDRAHSVKGVYFLLKPGVISATLAARFSSFARGSFP